MTHLTLVVLAAGLGSRYGGLKQLDGFGPWQETLLEYGVYDAIQAWFDRIVFIIRETFAEEFRDRIGHAIEKKAQVTYVYQEMESFVPSVFSWIVADRQKPRGTAHALLVAKHVVTTPFAVINADDFYGRAAYLQIADFLQTSTPEQMGLVGYVLGNTISPYGAVNRGVCRVKNNTLVSIHEHLKISPEGEAFKDHEGVILAPDVVVSMNFRWFHLPFFDDIENEFSRFLESYVPEKGGEYFIPLAVDQYLSVHPGACEVMMSHDIWCGVTYPEDKPFVQEHITALVQKEIYPKRLRD